ncbi:SpoIIE family protein phosphatase [Streptomyces seoulensis]|nr:SpoIIE family protein phosphatase [Streptomyces seoulensis]
MCDARRVSSEPAFRAKSGAASDKAALAKVVARQRAELDRLRDEAAASAVVERAKGALMALTGRTADAAHEELLRRAKAAGRAPAAEARITLDTLVPPLSHACGATATDGGATVPGGAVAPAGDEEDEREHAVDAASAPAPHAVQILFDALPGMTLLLSPLRSAAGAVEDFRIDAATPQAADPAGRRGRALVGRRVRACLPTVAAQPLWQGWLGALDTGEPYTSAPYAAREPGDGGGEPAAYAVRAARLDGRLVVTWRRQDASDRQEQLLADLQRLGHLGWATWNLVTGEAAWSAQVYALCERDPARRPLGLEGLADLAVPEDGPALARAVRAIRAEGAPLDVPFRIRTAAGVKHLRAVAEAVPDAAGRPVQVHGFVQDLTAQRSAELALLASEQAMLAQHGVLRTERMLAGRLQHALLPLPRRPVRLAGLRVDLAYLPAQSGIHVGGDWFSAIELPGGEALFVVGDVAGHGIDAVATMAQLRFTAKGMLFTGSSLTGALSRLNTLLLHSGETRSTATLVLARYHPGEHRLVWAQAGHLPPLLLRGGEARFLDRPRGVLLGATESPVFEEAECRLRPGDRLLLYTDGLVERPGESIQLGLERLARAAAAHRADAPGSLGPLLAALLEGERRDDVCVLDVRVPAEPAQES